MDTNSAFSGVIIKSLKQWDDDRGWLVETFRDDESAHKPAMSYISHTKYNVSRGPHEHHTQSDLFVFVGYGDFELYLWDNRKDSPTYKQKEVHKVGASNKVSVIVPPGVVHGYKSISEKGSLSINYPDKLYAGKNKAEKVDEIRHEDKDSEYTIE
jgi:dTDP-4-dehydrorhamnose 3,5-epimerase